MGIFYRNFAAAYGTCWLAMIAFAFLSQQHIDTGAFGLFGFPILSLVYAMVRHPHGESDERTLRRRVEALEDELDRMASDRR